MNGFTANGSSHLEKWSMVNQTLNRNKIAVLALQETHLDQGRVDELKSAFGKKMEIFFSTDPDAPRTTAGVALILNKSLIAPRKTTFHEILPGRVIMLKIEWLDDEATSIMNIYTPNNTAAQQTLWADIDTERQDRGLPAPNFLLGDFNVTEDAIDRMPPRLDDPNTIEALRNIKHSWGISDAWRIMYPDEREFTYRANSTNGQTKSQLDRIYVARDLTPLVYDCKIKPSPVPTDHWMVITKYAPKEALQIGKGRWTLPLHLLQDQEFINSVVTRGIQLQISIERLQQDPPR